MAIQAENRFARSPTTAGVGAHILVGLATVALFAAFVLALPAVPPSDTEAESPELPTPAARSPGRAEPLSQPPIIIVYGPPERTDPFRDDVAALGAAFGMDGSTIPEVIIDGRRGGQREVYFIDLR